MTCRRTLDLDLTAFVLEPRDAAWDEFRAHYPLCPDCSAEVAAWTTLQASLAQRHPDEESLLRWSDDPDSLDPSIRRSVAQHVERCPSCADELRALARFAETLALANEDQPRAAAAAIPAHTTAAVATRPASRRTASARRDGQRSHGRAGSSAARSPDDTGDARTRRGIVRRVLWHPALAYAALAIVLLLPTFRERFDDGAGRRELLGTTTTENVAQAPAKAAAPEPAQAPGGAAERYDAAAAAKPAERAAAEQRAEPPAALVDQLQAEQESAEADARRTEPQVFARRAQQPAAAPPPPAAPAQLQAPARGAAPAGSDAAGLVASGGTGAGANERLARARSSDAMQAPTTSRDAAPAMRLGAPTGAGTRTLVVTLPDAPADLGERGELEIRVIDPSGARELRQKVQRPTDAREVALDLPSAWLDAPSYEIEVYANGDALVARGTVSTR